MVCWGEGDGERGSKSMCCAQPYNEIRKFMGTIIDRCWRCLWPIQKLNRKGPIQVKSVLCNTLKHCIHLVAGMSQLLK